MSVKRGAAWPPAGAVPVNLSFLIKAEEGHLVTRTVFLHSHDFSQCEQVYNLRKTYVGVNALAKYGGVSREGLNNHDAIEGSIIQSRREKKSTEFRIYGEFILGSW